MHSTSQVPPELKNRFLVVLLFVLVADEVIEAVFRDEIPYVASIWLVVITIFGFANGCCFVKKAKSKQSSSQVRTPLRLANYDGRQTFLSRVPMKV